MKNNNTNRGQGPYLFAMLAFALLLLAACGDDPVIDAGDDTGLSLAGSWQLASLEVDGASVALLDRLLTMTIEAGMVSGDAGCNSFSGSIDRGDDGSLTLGPLAQTEMACEDLDFEVTYMAALSGATGWEGSPDGITFVGDNTRIVYRPHNVEPTDSAPLTGTVWVLDSIYGPGEGPERAVSSIDMSAPSVQMVIDAAGTATLLSDTCTDTVYEVDFTEGAGGGPFEAQGGGAVECTGSEGDNVNHDAASGALTSATGYMINGDRLTLIGDEGELVDFVAGDDAGN